VPIEGGKNLLTQGEKSKHKEKETPNLKTENRGHPERKKILILFPFIYFKKKEGSTQLKAGKSIGLEPEDQSKKHEKKATGGRRGETPFLGKGGGAFPGSCLSRKKTTTKLNPSLAGRGIA